jgi:mevalonate kinase
VNPDDAPASRCAVGTAPGKAILFGEHAVNRGQNALAISVGLRTRCRVTLADDGVYRFRSGDREETTTREEILALRDRIDAWRAAEDFESIRALARERFFGPQAYLLASALGKRLPLGMKAEYESEIPPNSGFGSGGSAYVALGLAVSRLIGEETEPEEIGRWAHLGDVIAHGGIASGLDTQTALRGGVLRYSIERGAEALPWHPSLTLVAAHCGIAAPTAETNGRVRSWLAERPSRIHYFREIGALADLAPPFMASGDGETLGRLLNLNQLLLEKIGVSRPEIDRLIDAALSAGAYGAKLSGSGGGGIVLALAAPHRRMELAAALREAGGTVYDAPFGVPGAAVEPPSLPTKERP